jgi:DNA-binding MarR family transcriptional regulator
MLNGTANSLNLLTNFTEFADQFHLICIGGPPFITGDAYGLRDLDNTVFAAIRKNPSYSYEQLADYCGFSRPTIARTIKSLQSKGLIHRIGSDKTGHWEF